MMDTPGIDDEGELGSLRVKKSYQVLNKTDAAVLVIDGKAGISREGPGTSGKDPEEKHTKYPGAEQERYTYRGRGFVRLFPDCRKGIGRVKTFSGKRQKREQDP